MLKNTSNTYGAVTKAFHWVVFIMLTLSVIAGYLLAAMPNGPDKFAAANTHKSFGVVILALVFLRLIWRLLNSTPQAVDGTSPSQHRMASAMHWTLYVLMFAQPLSGILMSQAAGIPVGFFKLSELPTLIDENESWAGVLRNVHGTVWIVLVLAVAGHVGAALYYHVFKRDETLRRMATLSSTCTTG